ncbi:hypothetical protein [Brevibacillus sp. NRS-1366]|uniref:hypothetical protein n=1 Tax=Brevibacillus sp. NRS-1366 TaxID=3233899 RepID=UPI003D20A43B
MNTNVSKKTTIIAYIIAISFIIGMVMTSVMMNDHEILLPEFAAMAIDSLILCIFMFVAVLAIKKIERKPTRKNEMSRGEGKSA